MVQYKEYKDNHSINNQSLLKAIGLRVRKKSEVNRALVRAILGWVTPWEVLTETPYHLECGGQIRYNIDGA